MNNINKPDKAIESIMLIILFIPIAIIFIILKLRMEHNKQKLIFAFAGNMDNENMDTAKDIFIDDTLIVKNNDKQYKLGSKFVPVRISGNSMQAKNILDNNIAVFDCKSTKSSYKKGDIVLIKMPYNDNRNPSKYKLRIFNEIKNDEILTSKYEYDKNNTENITTKKSKKHNEKYLIGKFKFVLNKKQTDYIYEQYSA